MTQLKQGLDEEEARRREMAAALARLTGASHARDVLVDLYAIGGRPVLDAVSHAISEAPDGRQYLAIHIHSVQRGGGPAFPQWRDGLRYMLVREGRAGVTKVDRHSAPMTCIRFMLVAEGFARLVNRAVSIERRFADAVRIALEHSSASGDNENAEPPPGPTRGNRHGAL
jgi:hypothetical protein